MKKMILFAVAILACLIVVGASSAGVTTKSDKVVLPVLVTFPTATTGTESVCMNGMTCSVKDGEEDCRCMTQEEIDNFVVPADAIIGKSEHISCDGWADVDEGQICVYNPDAVWADGTGKGNWISQDAATYPYDLIACPHDPLKMCAVEKTE